MKTVFCPNKVINRKIKLAKHKVTLLIGFIFQLLKRKKSPGRLEQVVSRESCLSCRPTISIIAPKKKQLKSIDARPKNYSVNIIHS